MYYVFLNICRFKKILESASRLLCSSQPQTSECLISHWRALCLLAHDNWRCSIQPEIITHQDFARSPAGESSVLTVRLHKD